MVMDARYGHDGTAGHTSAAGSVYACRAVYLLPRLACTAAACLLFYSSLIPYELPFNLLSPLLPFTICIFLFSPDSSVFFSPPIPALLSSTTHCRTILVRYIYPCLLFCLMPGPPAPLPPPTHTPYGRFVPYHVLLPFAARRGSFCGLLSYGHVHLPPITTPAFLPLFVGRRARNAARALVNTYFGLFVAALRLCARRAPATPRAFLLVVVRLVPPLYA